MVEVKERQQEGVDRINLAQEPGQRWTLVNRVMDVGIH